jgi:ketosteroid isomerase-like protein
VRELPAERKPSSDLLAGFFKPSGLAMVVRMSEQYGNKITELINKSEIADAVNSYFRALDAKDFDPRHFAAILTADAKMTRPNGMSLTGPEEISASHAQSFARFESSQHLCTVPDISIDGGTATVRANLVAMHMWEGSKANANNVDNFFVAGGVMDATLIQIDGRWKISRLSNTVIWRAGGFRNMLQTR